MHTNCLFLAKNVLYEHFCRGFYFSAIIATEIEWAELHRTLLWYKFPCCKPATCMLKWKWHFILGATLAIWNWGKIVNVVFYICLLKSLNFKSSNKLRHHHANYSGFTLCYGNQKQHRYHKLPGSTQIKYLCWSGNWTRYPIVLTGTKTTALNGSTKTHSKIPFYSPIWRLVK